MGADCAHATAECVEGTPNKLGPCVCERAFLSDINVDSGFPILAGAFQGDTFYWSTYIFISGAPVSIINSIPASTVIRVPNHAYALRVTPDTIYVSGDSQLFAFTLMGEALPTPTPEVAFPPTNTRVKSDEMGLHLDGALIAGPARSWSETADGVYYISESLPFGVDYIPFANPNDSHLALIEGSDVFEKVWASGTSVYAVHVRDGGLPQLSHADLSVVGKESTN
jgi:hypothetical protein